MQLDNYFEIGYVLKPHGLKGGLSIILDVDDPANYTEMESVIVNSDNQLIPFFVSSIQLNGSRGILHLEDIHSLEEAEKLRSSKLFLPIEVLPELENGKFYYHEVIGYHVVDEQTGRLGIIENVWVRNVQVKKAEGAFIRFETNYKGHRGNHFPPVFRNFTLENITCQDANIGIFAEGHKDALLQNITLKNIEMQKANHAYFIRYFSNFVMDNVRANSKLLPENPPKEMDKPQALKMGW